MLLLPSISVAASWQQSNFLSSGINGIEQYILIKRGLGCSGGGSGENGGCVVRGGMITGLPVCHLSTKSSPSGATTVLSELIMSRIKSGEEERKKEARAHSLTHSRLTHSLAHSYGVHEGRKIQISPLDYSRSLC